MNKNIGLIKWFEKEKGYGVIKTLNEVEVFVHMNGFQIPPDKLLTCTAVIFETNNGRNKPEAIRCHFPASYEDWKIIMSLLDKNDSVNIVK